VEDLRRLVAEAGGKMQAQLYSRTATAVASLDVAPATATATAVAAPPSSTTAVPPLTLSLGAWQIAEEDLPVLAGGAAGVLALFLLATAVTAWRCCAAPPPAAASAGKRKRGTAGE